MQENRPKGAGMKIVVFEAEDWEAKAFEELGDNHEIETVGEPLTADNADRYRDAEVISTFIYSKTNNDVLSRFDRLKLLSTRSTGLSHVDRDFCKEKGITVCNLPTYGKNTVAEHAFALLLALSRKIVPAVERTRKGTFSFQGLRGMDLRGKTIGVIGTGDIGECAIEIAMGFRMNVLAFDVKPREDLADRLGFEYASLERVCRESDIITLHVPGIPQTKHLISTEQFDQMKPGAIIINTSRGSVVDVHALTEALSKEKIAGAGLDVLAKEPMVREEGELFRVAYQENREKDAKALLADNVLMHMDNVIVTPHNAFNTQEAVERIIATTIENIRKFAEGNPQNVAVEPELQKAR